MIAVGPTIAIRTDVLSGISASKTRNVRKKEQRWFSNGESGLKVSIVSQSTYPLPLFRAAVGHCESISCFYAFTPRKLALLRRKLEKLILPVLNDAIMHLSFI